MTEHVVDDKGNGTFKTRCDMCKDYTGEKNYILSVRLDWTITTDQDIRDVLCKKMLRKAEKYAFINSWRDR